MLGRSVEDFVTAVRSERLYRVLPRAQWRGEDRILRAFRYREDAGRMKALLCSGRQHMQPAISAGQNKTDDDLWTRKRDAELKYRIWLICGAVDEPRLDLSL